MGAAGQPVVGPTPEPTPQPTPTPMPDMATQPVQPEPAATMEAQMNAEMAAEPVQPVAEEPQFTSAAAPEPKKKNMAGILGIALLAIVAIGGIVFGVMMMMQKDNAAKDYEAQIATLKKTNSELMSEISTQALTSDEALELLVEGATANQVPYTILNANVTAEYTGEEDIVSYWVKFTAYPTATPEAIAQYNTIFTQDAEDETWTFELPGFTNSDPKYSTLITDYTAITE